MDPTENTACIVDKACLPHRCLAIDPLLSRMFASAGVSSANGCLAMGMTQTLALPKNGSTCHIAPSLRLFVLNSPK
jgi:hypothetical protein